MKFFNFGKENKKTDQEEKALKPKENTSKPEPKKEVHPETVKGVSSGKFAKVTKTQVIKEGEVKASSKEEVVPPPLFGEVKKNDSFWGTGKEFGTKPYKPTKYEKLTILLIENTLQVQAQSANLAKIVNGIVTTGLVCMIHYGSFVRKSELVGASKIKTMELLHADDMGEKACLYDALLELEQVVSQKFMSVQENEKEKICINQIEVIGIGTCKNDGSNVAKDIGTGCFSKVLVKPNVVTKYFCLTDENVVHAAEVGFHSIGYISRNYQS